MYILKSVGVILLSLLIVGGLSHVTDVILESNGWMKIPFGQNPLWLMLVVTLYRFIYVAVGSYVTAALAPSKPMRLVLIGMAIGLLLGTMGAIVMWNEPPRWYPIAIVLSGIPASLLGGKLRLRNS
ncbi:MAG: hypothetical protein ACOYXT_20355 [Bacteroidota bacterium]